MRIASSPLSALDGGALGALHDRYRTAPETLDAGWRALFQILDEIDAATPSGAAHADTLRDQAIRAYGHLLARTDPFAADAPPPSPDAFAAHADTMRLTGPQLARRYAGTLTVETAHID